MLYFLVYFLSSSLEHKLLEIRDMVLVLLYPHAYNDIWPRVGL